MPANQDHLDLAPLLIDWKRHLRAKNLAPTTIQSYLNVAQQFTAANSNSGKPLPAAIEDYLADLTERTSAANSSKHYRSLRQLFRWLIDEGEISANPMQRMHPPKQPEQPVKVFSDAELVRLLAACKGNSFNQRRNAAMIRTLADTGIRSAELCGLQLTDVDLDTGQIMVMGKGRRIRIVPISARTSESISRYLRQRNRHTYAGLPDLWLGVKGRLTTSGLGQLLDRVGLRASVSHVYPHRFRHSSAHLWLANGGSERGLMRIMGWKSASMLGRYGASAQDERARDEFRRLDLGSRL